MKRNPRERRMVYARLQAAGIPLPVEEQPVMNRDLQVESLKGGRAFALKMGSEFLLNVRISNRSYADLKIEKLEGHLLEANWWLDFQGDPRKYDRDRKMYRMLSGRYVRHKSVLNHRLHRNIAPGASVEGKLLALSVTGEIPEEYMHGQRVPLELILTDQYGRRFAAIFEVSVDRSATMSKPIVSDRVGRGLYEGSPVQTPEFDYRAPSEVPAGKADTGESREKRSEWMKKLDTAFADLKKAGLDAIPAESTSPGDEMEVESRQRQKRRRKVRPGKGSGLYGPDATGEPADLSFEEDARRRLVKLLAQEKNAEQQRVAGIVYKK